MTERASGSWANRLLSPFAQLREGEATTALLMFAYSFMAMTGYNIIKPVTRGLFISKLGPDNLPWVQFGAGIVIGLIMQIYTRAIAVVPRRWMIPVTQAGMVGLLVMFYLMFASFPDAKPIAAGFYLYGLILGILLTSQFWTLANDVYDPRQAKRLFGMIGAGSTLGAATGSGLTVAIVERIGVNQMLLASAVALALCAAIVIAVVKREPSAGQSDASKNADEKGVGAGEAFRLLASSQHLQTIALIIGFGAVGAAIVEQQLNMAAAEAKGATNEGAVTAFLAQVTVYLSLIAFVIQAGLTSRIHRLLGIGFAMMILPFSLGITGSMMLVTGALWTASAARIVDTSLRYTIDKTTREILFLPLPVDLKYRAKPFIDVTVDRFAKGVGALLILVLIKDWGLGLSWQRLSIASLSMVVLWMLFALRARREYLKAFRRSIEQQDVQPSEIRLDTADLNTIETLLLELSHPDPRRVIYGIDLLESLDKRHLVTPLLLHHESVDVRARALQSAAAAPPAHAHLWARGAERALKDPDGGVRLAAVRALSAIRKERATEMMRPFLHDPDPRMAITAATALASSAVEADRVTAEETLRELASDNREQAGATRAEVARALGDLADPRFKLLLVPLMFDPSIEVAREAIQSAGRLSSAEFIFVAPLISLMRNRLLKPAARAVLVGYGEEVIDTLAYFLKDKDEDIWIRRHVPSTLGMIPSQRSLDVLVGAMADEDGFIRFKSLAAIDRIRRARPDLQFDRVVVEKQILAECTRSFGAQTLLYNLSVGGQDEETLLARALQEKATRARNRIFRLLGMLHPPDDIAAVRSALTQSDARLRSGAIEYLDNLLTGDVRRRVMMLVEEMPQAERIRRGNSLFRTRVRDVEDTLAQLIHDDEEVIAAAAIQVVERRGLWSLADDIEHVLAHRDPRDWAVFEAASWALAAQRLSPDRRRALWLEPLPAVELADRLRKIPLFGFASVDELFRIAGLGRQVRHESGRVLYERGRPAETLQVLLDGRVTIDDDKRSRTIEAPAMLAFENVLEGSPLQVTLRAAEPCICLSLTGDEFLSLLSENVEIAQGIFRLLIETRGECFEAGDAAEGERIAWDSVLPGSVSPELQRRMADGIQAVELVLLLQTSPLLARATSAQLVTLANIARPIALKPGADPLVGLEPSILVVLTGSVRVERDGHAVETADAGDIVGIAETLGGMPFTSRAEVVTEGRGLRFGRAELFDVLADNIELLQGIFSGLLRARTTKVRA